MDWLVLPILIGLLAGCAVGLPCYWYGWRVGSGPLASCFWRHRWSHYGAPKEVTGSDGSCEVGQRRECERCAAVDYRRVQIHN